MDFLNEEINEIKEKIIKIQTKYKNEFEICKNQYKI